LILQLGTSQNPWDQVVWPWGATSAAGSGVRRSVGRPSSDSSRTCRPPRSNHVRQHDGRRRLAEAAGRV